VAYSATIAAGPDYEARSRIETGPIPTSVWLTGFWLALFIIRPWEELFPELRTFRFERIYALTVLGVVIGSGLLKIRACRQTYAVLLFLTALALSTVLAYDASLAWTEFYKYLTLVVFYFVLLSVARTPHQLVFIILCYIVAMAAYLGKAEWEYVVHGRHQFSMGVSRMVGIESTFGHPNSVAGSTVLSLPFLQFLWWRRREIADSLPQFFRRWFSPFLVAYFTLAITAVILTNSRAGAVGFTVFVILFGATRPQSPKRIKRAVFAILALAALWVFVPEATKNRIRTIWNSEAGPASAKSSADTREESLRAGFAMFSRRPITGVGIGNTAVYRQAFIDGVFLAPHNFYGEVFGETGIIGAAAFIFLIASLFANIRATRNLARSYCDPTITTLADLARTCGYVVVLLLVSGITGDGMLRFQWLWLAAFALLARNFSESISKELTDSPEGGDGNPL
jgi:O-antigen ligase